jgi:uncharacterized lipoprotein YddW (UPF0748 family)
MRSTLAAVFIAAVPSLLAQTTDTLPPPVAREFRGVWVASVSNIDWPSRPGLPVAEQKSELLAILDRAAALKLNAIILQVRPAADALYASKLEPWSAYLMGRMGQAPDPYYDPLTFAIEEAHARGLELHAWVNPYRAHDPSDKSPIVPGHIARRHPELVRRYGPFLWMDPGSPTVRDITRRVVVDIVKRYDIDGMHIDDYFYPYPERCCGGRGREMSFPDDRTWKQYKKTGGTLARDDWRRHNVDLLVQQLYQAVKKEKPWVKFGISPFGIWRPGFPESVRGFDAYADLYADSRKWLQSGWADYFTPQLYWRIDAAQQSYPVLLRWWADQNILNRHLWAGNYTSRVGLPGQMWRASEMLDQIRLTRDQAGATGNVHFSMLRFLQDRDSLVERLMAGPYAEPALVPASEWLARGAAPSLPMATVSPDTISGRTLVTMRAAGKDKVWQWVVQAHIGDQWTTSLLPGSARRYTFASSESGVAPDAVFVTAVDRVGLASAPTRALSGPEPAARPEAPRREEPRRKTRLTRQNPR